VVPIICFYCCFAEGDNKPDVHTSALSWWVIHKLKQKLASIGVFALCFIPSALKTTWIIFTGSFFSLSLKHQGTLHFEVLSKTFYCILIFWTLFLHCFYYRPIDSYIRKRKEYNLILEIDHKLIWGPLLMLFFYLYLHILYTLWFSCFSDSAYIDYYILLFIAYQQMNLLLSVVVTISGMVYTVFSTWYVNLKEHFPMCLFLIVLAFIIDVLASPFSCSYNFRYGL
jgi:hypothetical protein